MTTVALIQARMGSTRLPGKVLRLLGGRPVIDWVFNRAARAKRLDRIVLATSENPADDILAAHAAARGIAVERGSEHDVLDRYARAAMAQSASIVVRITADCPLIDPALIDAVIALREGSGVDYASNADPATYPNGLDVEVFTAESLAFAAREATSPYDREHVTPFLRSGCFRKTVLRHTEDLSALRWTVDEDLDLEALNRLVTSLGGRDDFGWEDAAAVWQASADTFAVNKGLTRNEGSILTDGQKLRRRANRIMAGGNITYSARSGIFRPNGWPAFIDRAKGCAVREFKGRDFIDMSLMSGGVNILGYGHPEVDDAAKTALEAGTLSSAREPEEVWLAEKLLEIVHFAEMAFFTNSDDAAKSAAIRIARAASGRSGVAVCGRQIDWLPNEFCVYGAERGPHALTGESYSFNYNDIAKFEAMLADDTIGAILMEPAWITTHNNGFLAKARDLAAKRGVVVIFDECSTGFRETYGGYYQKSGVEPDIVIFGRALGNGHAISAVVGRREVMEAAQDSFISSTPAAGRISYAAALTTLKVMAREFSWERITAIGQTIRAGWQELAIRHSLTIKLMDQPTIASFRFGGEDPTYCEMLMMQAMLAGSYIAEAGVYASLAHTAEVIERYIEVLDPAFALIARYQQGLDAKEFENRRGDPSGYRLID